jgi:hypothetical protein
MAGGDEMNSMIPPPAPVLTYDPKNHLKAVCSLATLARMLEKAIAAGCDGGADYAVKNFYFAADGIFTIDHGAQPNTDESRTLKQNQTT